MTGNAAAAWSVVSPCHGEEPFGDDADAARLRAATLLAEGQIPVSLLRDGSPLVVCVTCGGQGEAHWEYMSEDGMRCPASGACPDCGATGWLDEGDGGAVA